MTARQRRLQVRRFRGLDARALKDLNVLAAEVDNVKGGDLDPPIHRMYRRAQWETEGEIWKHVGPIPIRGENDGVWNPRVGYWLVGFFPPFPLSPFPPFPLSHHRRYRKMRMFMGQKLFLTKEDRGRRKMT